MIISIIQKRLTGEIDRAGSAYEAFPELRYTLREQSIVPDITIIRGDRVRDAEHYRIPVQNTAVSGAPDWMIEILSGDQNIVLGSPSPFLRQFSGYSIA